MYTPIVVEPLLRVHNSLMRRLEPAENMVMIRSGAGVRS
jgi:hypothetical protein